MTPHRILVIDADPRTSDRVLSLLPPTFEYQFHSFETGEAALDRLEAVSPDAIFLSWHLPGLSGSQVLRRIEESGCVAPVVVLTPPGELEVGIEAMRQGAYDFLVRPLDSAAFEGLAERLHLTADWLQDDAEELPSTGDAEGNRLLGTSRAILNVCRSVGRVSDSQTTVLITGESGVGKELVAQLIHSNSVRSDKPLRTVNCAAIPEDLLQAELFGHEKGAFTGAEGRRIGKFEAASGGTLFLDEVGDMSLSNQRKILRAIESRTIERLGGDRSIPVDVRVIAATHRDLPRAVESGAFRKDLYYRLAVVTIHVPALRERREDIRVLTDHFVARFSRRSGRRIDSVCPYVYDLLEAHSWPGNVRELRNVLERSVVMGRGPVLTVDELPPLGADGEEPAASERNTVADLARGEMSLADLEARYIHSVLREVKWHYGKASDVLQIHRNTLRRKIQRYGLEEGS